MIPSTAIEKLANNFQKEMKGIPKTENTKVEI